MTTPHPVKRIAIRGSTPSSTAKLKTQKSSFFKELFYYQPASCKSGKTFFLCVLRSNGSIVASRLCFYSWAVGLLP